MGQAIEIIKKNQKIIEKKRQRRKLIKLLFKVLLFSLLFSISSFTYFYLNSLLGLTQFLNFGKLNFTLFGQLIVLPSSWATTGEFFGNILFRTPIIILFSQLIYKAYFEYIYSEKNKDKKKEMEKKSNGIFFSSFLILACTDIIRDFFGEIEHIFRVLLRDYTVIIFLFVYLVGFVIGSIKRVLNIMDKQTNASLKLMYTNEGKSETATKTSNPFFKNIFKRMTNLALALAPPSFIAVLISLALNQSKTLIDLQLSIEVFGQNIMILNNLNNKLLGVIISKIILDLVFNYVDLDSNDSVHRPRFKKGKKIDLKSVKEFAIVTCLSISTSIVYNIITSINVTALNIEAIANPYVAVFGFFTTAALCVLGFGLQLILMHIKETSQETVVLQLQTEPQPSINLMQNCDSLENSYIDKQS